MDKATPKTSDVFQVNRDRAAPLLAKLRADGIGHLIGGEIVPSISGETFETKSPIDGAVLAPVARGGSEDIDRAATGRLRWPLKRGAACPRPCARSSCIGSPMPSRSAPMILPCSNASTPARPTASWPSRNPRRGKLRFFADKCTDARDGLNTPSDEHWNVSTRVPIGPVGVITPWNTPFMLSTWKIAPALAAGCTVVHKPAEWSPITADLLAKLVKQAGVPDGVLNTVHGIGEEAGKALTQHPAIKAIGFVGESSTGSAIMAQGAPTLKRVHFELGGKNPVIVFGRRRHGSRARCGRVHDLLAQWRALHFVEPAAGAGKHRGQIHRKTHRAGEGAQGGHPLDPATEIGPLIHERHLEKVCSYFDVARKDGAVIAVGGRTHDGPRRRALCAADIGDRGPCRNAHRARRSVRSLPDSDPVPRREERRRDRQRRAIRPHRLCLDHGHGPRATRRRCARGRHDSGSIPKTSGICRRRSAA